MNTERLLKLADYLETVPENEFDMNLWQNHCGTKACAIGHATRIPEFKEAGLTLRKAEVSGIWYPIFENCSNYGAIALFFGITAAEAATLFEPFPMKYFGPNRMARDIRRFVQIAQIQS